MKVQRDGRPVTVTVTADGDEQTVNHAGANTATDHITVLDDALAALPRPVVEHEQIVMRTDSAGATLPPSR